MSKKIVHIVATLDAYTTLCGRSSGRTLWVPRDRAKAATCGDCQRFHEGRLMNERAEVASALARDRLAEMRK